jgi:uncharacterized membrane protein (DUF4010 family)
MFGRVLVEVAVVHRPLLSTVAVPMAAMGTAAGLVVLVLFLRRPKGEEPAAAAPAPSKPADRRTELALRNPFSLTAAIRFAAFFALVLLAVAGVRANFPGRGVYAVAALAGLTDVDAITLSMAEAARGGEDAHRAAIAIGIAVISNTAVKTGIVLVLGSARLKLPVTLGALAIAAAGAVSLLVG